MVKYQDGMPTKRPPISITTVLNVVVECIYEPYVFRHSVAMSSAECNRCNPPSSLVCGQLLTICDILCHLPQGHMSVAARPHFIQQDALFGPEAI